jgi:tetratricopeptide (TPR) repeat protein
VLQKGLATTTDAGALSLLGRAYALAGNQEEAIRVLDKLNTLSQTRFLSGYPLAALHLALGDKEQAFESLNRAYGEHAWNMIFLNVDPQFDALRGEPRFQILLRRIGLAR